MTSAPRCLVFGGSGALGRVVCQALADKGGRVAFTYHSGESVARELAPRLPDGMAWPLDLAGVAGIERTIDQVAAKFGGIDAFVQCAGVGVTVKHEGPAVHHRMEDVGEDGWNRMMDINAKSAFFAVRRLSAVMRGHGGGNIVLTGSIDGVKPVPAPVHYAASKGALAAMVASMAKELGEFKIKVNGVAPGILEGGISRVLPETLKNEYLKHCGLKRLGKFPEIANVITWLALHNTYVTGQSILVDGAL